jgi:hypothetical protein
MDYEPYFTEWLVKTRLGEAQALAERLALLDARRPLRRPACIALGLALIRLGCWVLGDSPARREFSPETGWTILRWEPYCDANGR